MLARGTEAPDRATPVPLRDATHPGSRPLLAGCYPQGMGRVDEFRAIGVVVPAHEDPVGLHRCLEALEGAGRPLHVVVVDDASASPEQAAALEALEAGARVEVLRNERNLGFAGTSNRGLRRAVERGCDAILLLNQDALVARSTLERLVTALEQRPAAAAVGPRTLSMGASSDGRRMPTRVLAMRAVCADGRLERRSSDQSWSSYPSRPDTAVKVRWMCSLP